MIGRRLKRDIECDVQPQVPRGRHEAIEVFERAQSRIDRGMAARIRSDGPGAARIAGGGPERIVAPLAIGGSDRVNGCEVQHVETEVGNLRQPAFDVAKGAWPIGVARAGAWEQLVPGAKSRTHGIDHHFERAFRCGRRASVGAGMHEASELGIARRRNPHRLREAASQDRRNLPQPPTLLVVRTPTVRSVRL